jgi:hypothetical protein
VLIEADKNYTVQELAEAFGWSDNTIRPLFRHHPLVTKKPGATRQRVAIRIPGTVALQVFGDMQREPIIVKMQKVKKEKKKVWLRPEKHNKAIARADALATTQRAAAA